MNKQNHKCGIINIGSAYACVTRKNFYFPKENYEVYQASKAYLLSFTTLLDDQYSNIDVLLDMPATFNIYKKGITDIGFGVTPERHVEIALRSLGKTYVTNGTLRHST